MDSKPFEVISDDNQEVILIQKVQDGSDSETVFPLETTPCRIITPEPEHDQILQTDTDDEEALPTTVRHELHLISPAGGESDATMPARIIINSKRQDGGGAQPVPIPPQPPQIPADFMKQYFQSQQSGTGSAPCFQPPFPVPKSLFQNTTSFPAMPQMNPDNLWFMFSTWCQMMSMMTNACQQNQQQGFPSNPPIPLSPLGGNAPSMMQMPWMPGGQVPAASTPSAAARGSSETSDAGSTPHTNQRNKGFSDNTRNKSSATGKEQDLKPVKIEPIDGASSINCSACSSKRICTCIFISDTSDSDKDDVPESMAPSNRNKRRSVRAEPEEAHKSDESSDKFDEDLDNFCCVKCSRLFGRKEQLDDHTPKCNKRKIKNGRYLQSNRMRTAEICDLCGYVAWNMYRGRHQQHHVFSADQKRRKRYKCKVCITYYWCPSEARNHVACYHTSGYDQCIANISQEQVEVTEVSPKTQKRPRGRPRKVLPQKSTGGNEKRKEASPRSASAAKRQSTQAVESKKRETAKKRKSESSRSSRSQTSEAAGKTVSSSTRGHSKNAEEEEICPLVLVKKEPNETIKKGTYSCHKCKQRFRSIQDVMNHQASHDPLDSMGVVKKFTCTICHTYYPSKPIYDKHIRQHHPE